mgnify:CR=1 FL=1
MADKKFDSKRAEALRQNSRIKILRLTPALDNVLEKVDPNKGSQFLGYADLQLQTKDGLNLRFPDVCLKLVGSKLTFQFDAPTKQYESNKGETKYPPMWFPADAETRAVLTRNLESNAEVKERIEAVKAALENGGGEASDGDASWADDDEESEAPSRSNKRSAAADDEIPF